MFGVRRTTTSISVGYHNGPTRTTTIFLSLAALIVDRKFLNFFFSRIRPINDKESQFLAEHDIQNEYPFLSPCGEELNFIRPAATPIVYHTFREYDQCLLFGGNLEHAFDPTQLAISSTTGRMYHRFTSKNKNITNSQGREQSLSYGLIRSSIAVALSEKIGFGEESSFIYNDEYKIEWLPQENEPGVWAMPDDIPAG
jgi:Domain of unknown function (DUF4505)